MSERFFGGAFQGRRVFITGHTGFKGAWLTRWLLELGSEIRGYALESDTTPSMYGDLALGQHIDSHIGDIRDRDALERTIADFRPEFVLHLAAQPLVLRSYRQPVYTFETNVMGTVNLLSAVRACDSVRAVVNVTTDKVYQNREAGEPFTESEPLGGHDPYSASKACSELVTSSMRDSFFSNSQTHPMVATARAGNVVGGGDWAEDRLVPDIVRALSTGRSLTVRRPEAVRPWQHVLDPLSGYLHLAAALSTLPEQLDEAWNFGPDPTDSRSVRDVVDAAISEWGNGSWESMVGDIPHEAMQLTLSTEKARTRLGWRPTWGFEACISRTVRWYRRYTEDARGALEATAEDISVFVNDARAAGAPWT